MLTSGASLRTAIRAFACAPLPLRQPPSWFKLRTKSSLFHFQPALSPLLALRSIMRRHALCVCAFGFHSVRWSVSEISRVPKPISEFSVFSTRFLLHFRTLCLQRPGGAATRDYCLSCYQQQAIIKTAWISSKMKSVFVFSTKKGKIIKCFVCDKNTVQLTFCPAVASVSSISGKSPLCIFAKTNMPREHL